MVYVALLRGINVGGNRKVDMRRLKVVFERAGFEDVETYINSGNVIFKGEPDGPASIRETLESAIESEFGFAVRVVVRDADGISSVARALPDSWSNDKEAKCDVMFLGEEIDEPDIVARLTIKPEIDDVRYVPGALLWWVERPKVTRSGMMKLVGTDLYAQMTVRNCNTARKLDALVRAREANPQQPDERGGT